MLECFPSTRRRPSLSMNDFQTNRSFLASICIVESSSSEMLRSNGIEKFTFHAFKWDGLAGHIVPFSFTNDETCAQGYVAYDRRQPESTRPNIRATRQFVRYDRYHTGCFQCQIDSGTRKKFRSSSVSLSLSYDRLKGGTRSSWCCKFASADSFHDVSNNVATTQLRSWFFSLIV